MFKTEPINSISMSFIKIQTILILTLIGCCHLTTTVVVGLDKSNNNGRLVVGNADILTNYKPLAVDESRRLIKMPASELTPEILDDITKNPNSIFNQDPSKDPGTNDILALLDPNGSDGSANSLDAILDERESRASELPTNATSSSGTNATTVAQNSTTSTTTTTRAPTVSVETKGANTTIATNGTVVVGATNSTAKAVVTKLPVNATTSRPAKHNNDKPPVVDIKDSAGKNISETLFKLPEETTAKLTDLITGKEKPTFIQTDPVRPILIEATDKKSSGKDGNILASYKILFPILLPAIKKKALVRDRLGQRMHREDFVKETRTEMVPVTKQVPVLKTVYKAERIPQRIVTDFVRTDRKVEPSRADDKLKPNEELIKTVVTNFN